MTDREKLYKLLDEAINDEDTSYYNIVDYLLENGVIVPPCRVGQTVYTVGIFTGQIIQSKVLVIDYEENDVWLHLSNATYVSVNQQLGKSFFFTKEEAEKALQELNNTN